MNLSKNMAIQKLQELGKLDVSEVKYQENKYKK